jgi:hypothetical protein
MAEAPHHLSAWETSVPSRRVPRVGRRRVLVPRGTAGAAYGGLNLGARANERRCFTSEGAS